MDGIVKVAFLVKRFKPVFLQVGARGTETKKRSCAVRKGQLRNFVL